MRTGLIVIAVIFLVIGGFLYFVPTQTAQATTAAVGVSPRTWYATFSVPRTWSYVVLIIGAVLLVLGFVLPGTRVVVPVVPETRRTTTHSSMRMKEKTIDDEGNKRTVVRREEREE